ncbi:MAG: alpha-L-glutamate ligase-like protein [Bdellovibrionaceae bacterium]|jgi:alpha-L-glutamate ligase-like protein|nr:alpha-L-glutamate ligase-like protein [Pseudobdellovibrionaceae bacterium]
MIKFLKDISNANEVVLGMNRRNVEYIRKYNSRRDYPLADNKIFSKIFFKEHGLPAPVNIKTYSNLYELNNLKKDLSLVNDFVVKPASGSQGNGIIVVVENKQDHVVTISGKILSLDNLKYECASILFGKYSQGNQDEVIVEERIITCEELKKSSEGGLPDIRIIVIDEVPYLAMLRLPTLESKGKANLHQGGIGVGIDILTGHSNFAHLHGNKIIKHPRLDLDLSKIQIPYWQEILDITKKLSKKSPLKYIGVDMTIDEHKGPMILEFNARPGLEIQNANQVGMLSLFKQIETS